MDVIKTNIKGSILGNWSIFQFNTNNIKIQFCRYILVGGVAFLVDFSLLAILTEVLNIHYLISAAFAFITGILINYLLSINWVFNERRIEEQKKELFIFGIIGVFGLIFNEVIMWIFSSNFELHYLGSKLIAVVIVFAWNFLARKFILFSKK